MSDGVGPGGRLVPRAAVDLGDGGLRRHQTVAQGVEPVQGLPVGHVERGVRVLHRFSMRPDPPVAQSRTRRSRSRSYAGRQASATAASCGERSTSRGRYGSKPVEASDGVVPVRRPHAVGLARPGRPAQHPVGERRCRASRTASAGATRGRAGSRRSRSPAVGPRSQRVEQPLPAGAARCRRARRTRASGRRTRRPRRGRGSAARCGTRRSSPASTSSSEVVGHVLGVVHGRGVVGARARGPPPPGTVGCEAITSSRPGVVEAGAGQVGGVERLVDHDGVGPVLPGAHHRRGDVARARPHRHRGPVGRSSVRPAADVGGHVVAGRAPAAGARPARARRCRSCGRRPSGPARPPRRCRSRTPRAAL